MLNVEELIEILLIVLVQKVIMMMNYKKIVRNVLVKNASHIKIVRFVKTIFKFQNVIVIEN